MYTATRDARLEPFVIRAGDILIKDVPFDETPFELKEIKPRLDEGAFIYGEMNVELVSARGIDGGSGPIGQWPFVTSQTPEEDKKEILDREDNWPTNFSHWPWRLLDDRWSIFND